MELLLHDPTLGPADIAQRLRITSASAMVLVASLELSGHLVRKPHPQDGRRRVPSPLLHALQMHDERFTHRTGTGATLSARGRRGVRSVFAALISPVARPLQPRQQRFDFLRIKATQIGDCSFCSPDAQRPCPQPRQLRLKGPSSELREKATSNARLPRKALLRNHASRTTRPIDRSQRASSPAFWSSFQRSIQVPDRRQ
jgi:MarR family